MGLRSGIGGPPSPKEVHPKHQADLDEPVQAHVIIQAVPSHAGFKVDQSGVHDPEVNPQFGCQNLVIRVTPPLDPLQLIQRGEEEGQENDQVAEHCGNALRVRYEDDGKRDEEGIAEDMRGSIELLGEIHQRGIDNLVLFSAPRV